MGGPADECCPPNGSVGLNPSSHWSEMPESTYALDNDQKGAGTSLSWLAQMLDPGTKAILDGLIPEGGSCLELGAGTGSIAGWMADRVGAKGDVVAVDIDKRHVQAHQFLQIVEHDLRLGLPADLAEKKRRLIHARCLLAHLGNRDTFLNELADALAPGGYLVVEEWGADGAGRVEYSPMPRTYELWTLYQQAMMANFRANGNDGRWPQRVHTRMVEAGLEARTLTRAESWRGGTAGCRLPISLSAQIEDDLVRHGMTRDDLEELRNHLNDKRVVLLANTTWSFIGRKPVEG